MKGCAIYVGEEECYRFDTVPDRKTNVTCGSGVLRGRIVKVSKNTTGISGGDITINICEVQVLSCRNDSWGSGCDMRCGNCSNGEVCDKVTGHCSSCPLGLQPPLCDTDCTHRTFGHNCTQTCSAGCEDVCDKVSGNCTCKPGWLGPACDAGEKPPSTTGFPVGAVIGSVCALVVLVIVAVFLVRWLRSRSLVNKEERATDAASHETVSTQNSSLSDHRNPVTLSPIQSDNVYEAVEGEVNHGYVNSQQANNPSECSSAIPENVLEVESSGELPVESSAPSNDQPNEIVDRDRENTYEKPRMYVNTGDHHVYSDLNI
ncbi:multiple epidermal growth factor-like domains protein 11 [Littorina saxatilis]|uniref:multiple epidermal growth factor-like domains protein 11 n=1 Tax=Littorina saxatilis TaxID=31220 RepID=UPI0038B569A4